MPLSRRCFLDLLGLGALAQSCTLSPQDALSSNEDLLETPAFKTRGVVLSVADLESLNWPQLASNAGLTTIGTHITPAQVAEFIGSANGEEFLIQCSELGLQVEHELHAMGDLLPRNLFTKDPNMFRMDAAGNRVQEANFCVHSDQAVAIICENAIKYAEILPSTTGRYFFWMDDAQPMCRCRRCRVYFDSDQALILENAMLSALRKRSPESTLAHLAYMNTLRPPSQVQPETGVFLEFAPINRTWDRALSASQSIGRDRKTTHQEILDLLDGNLEVFGSDNAQVLEYWLDVSLFSDWNREAAVELPWNLKIFMDDIDTYARRGIRHITSFSVYIDAGYLEQYGDIHFLTEYGNGLFHYKPQNSFP